MCGPGNKHPDSDETVDESASYYYDDATGYEIYRDDEDDEEGEGEPEPAGAGEPEV